MPKLRNLSSRGLPNAHCTPPTAFSLLLCDKLSSSRTSLIERGSFSMAISQDLLEILACPACKAKVELKPDGSGLKCVQCHRLYPIRDDIPVMLIDEATIEDEEPARNS
jgi:uncharacterized protein YbaR (Trm112 family)